MIGQFKKQPTPTEWHLFKGDVGGVDYTITANRATSTEIAIISGQICVTNSGSTSTQNLAINVEVRQPPNGPVVATTSVDLSNNPVLDPGESYCYNYSVNVPTPPVEGGTYKVTANVTITNHSGHLGDPFGPSPSATINFPLSPSLVNDTVHIQDTNFPSTWTATSSFVFGYNKPFTCDEDAGVHTNTATIVETGASSSVSVNIHCYSLDINKTVNTSYDRTFNWNIDKTVDTSSVNLSLGATTSVTYNINLTATYTERQL